MMETGYEGRSTWSRLVSSAPCLSARAKEQLASRGHKAFAAGALTLIVSIGLVLFGALCHADQFCWWWTGSVFLMVLGLLMLTPTLILACILGANWIRDVREESAVRRVLEEAARRGTLGGEHSHANRKKMPGVGFETGIPTENQAATNPLAGVHSKEYLQTPTGDSVSSHRQEIEPQDL
eukprot:TRINITY_DN19165_c0_g2_i2.p2 TRINITY_DN19165_c0_g2~~TRINITY_DN19165_c0_g2_i2.p2  ORF type:complete len:180 (-),score=34.30 TRINITY_DN19165_c0_g2_i2:361-900(-)